MSMFITYNTRDTINLEREVHVSFTRELLQSMYQSIEPGMVTAVQADGDELHWIRSHITGIPFCLQNRVERWYGDDARFIVGNLFR